MREIIPLKKDIVFKTLIGKITSIDINHDYKVKDDLIEGNVILSGSYKMTEASVIEEDFYYKIPFGVALSKRIKKDTIKIGIDDFNYDFDKDIMSINVDLELSCEEENEEKDEEEYVEEKVEDNLIDDYFKEEVDEKAPSIKEEKTDIDIEQNITNITNNIINNDSKYYTYKVYIVREGDNVETICSKYNVTINDLKDYNNIDDIKVGDKIIIPQLNE